MHRFVAQFVSGAGAALSAATFKKAPAARNLIIAGNCGVENSHTIPDSLRYAADTYEHVFVVPGREDLKHDWQEQGRICPRIPAMTAFLRNTCKVYPNIHVLCRDTFDLPDVRILGATMWPYIPAQYAAQYTAYVDRLHSSGSSSSSGSSGSSPVETADHCNRLHSGDVTWLLAELLRAAQDRKPAIVVSHFAPSFDGIPAAVDVPHPHVKHFIASPVESRLLNGAHEHNVPYWIYGSGITATTSRLGSRTMTMNNPFGIEGCVPGMLVRGPIKLT
jgi:hypothetical protein